VRGWGASGCSNLTASGARGGVARDDTIFNKIKFLFYIELYLNIVSNIYISIIYKQI